MARKLRFSNLVNRHAQSYARQVLAERGWFVRAEQTPLLTPLPRTLYAGLGPNDPWYVPGQTKWFEAGETRRINSASVLQQLGLAIVPRKVTKKERWAPKGKVQYLLVPWGPDEALPKLPPHHWAEYSPSEGKVCLHGANAGPLGVGSWIDASVSRQKGKGGDKMDPEHFARHTDRILSDIMREIRGVDVEVEPCHITDVALAVTEANEVICLPADLGDMPTYLIIGERASGKSTFKARLLSAAYWNASAKWKLALLNDVTRESGSWTLPNASAPQKTVLQRLHESPRPLPIVPIHPKVKEDYEKLFFGDVGVEMTLPWREILQNHRRYLPLEKTQEYLARILPQLLEMRSEKEILEFLGDEKKLKKTYGIPEGSVNALRASLETLFAAKMTSLSSPLPPWTLTRGRISVGGMNPVAACLVAGLIPSLQTSYISDLPRVLSTYEAYVMHDLWARQVKGGEDPLTAERRDLLVFLEELHNLCKPGQPSPADHLVRRFAREGRNRNIGLVGVDQFFTRLPEEITGVATHLTIFRDAMEADDIAKLYQLPIREEVRMLDTHQCVMFARDVGGFVVYDQGGNRRPSGPHEWFVARTLPPLCMHLPPSVKESGPPRKKVLVVKT